ncbi:MAG: hypothetical protein M0Z53_13590 [Thermaerobacter sp.]|nr:hypothetical protein [Thermaerobacter sp.]
MRIGIAQLAIDADPGRVAANRDNAARMAADLFERGAELVVLPELTHHGYFPKDRHTVEALGEDLESGTSVGDWMRIARQYHGYIVGGLLERDDAGLYNAAVLVGPAGLVARYRKVHLFDWEKKWLLPGNQWVAAYLPDLDVTVGLLVCYDLRFPEAVRQIADQGADLLAVPTTWTSIGKPVLWDDGGYCLQNHLAIAHAYCNRLAVVCADRVGQERGVTYLGASLAVHPSGQVAAGPLAGTAAMARVAEVDVRAARSKELGLGNHLVRDRRPELYGGNGAQRTLPGKGRTDP